MTTPPTHPAASGSPGSSPRSPSSASSSACPHSSSRSAPTRSRTRSRPWTSIKNALLAPDDGTLILGLFKVIGWVAWAFMALSLVVEAIARLRRVEAPQLPGLGRPQAAARGLIGLAALLFIAAPHRRAGRHASHGRRAAPATVGHVQRR